MTTKNITHADCQHSASLYVDGAGEIRCLKCNKKVKLAPGTAYRLRPDFTRFALVKGGAK